MQINQQALKEFREIWEADHPGQKLTDEQALLLATKVMRIVKMVYLPVPQHKTLIDTSQLASSFEQRYHTLVAPKPP
jgi:hypothetical protein